MKNKNRVRVFDTRYISSPEKGVTTCLLSCSLQLEKSPFFVILDVISPAWRKKVSEVDRYGEFVVVGVARCNPEDRFDEEAGRRIAESRAKIKAFKVAARVWKCIGDKWREAAGYSDRMIDACKGATEVEDNHLELLTED